MPWNTPKTNFANGDVLAASEMNAIGQNLAMFNGGTTGQVLAKTGSADGAWAWTSETDPNAIPKTLIDAKGDLIAGTAADTAGRLAVGTNGQILTADSTTATGLKWATAGTAPNWALISSAALTGATTITISGISGKNQLLIVILDGSSANASSFFDIRFNSDGTAKYNEFGQNIIAASAYASGNFTTRAIFGTTAATVAGMSGVSTSTISGAMTVQGCNGSGLKVWNLVGASVGSTNNGQYSYNLQGFYEGTSTISSVSLRSSSGNFDAGTLYVYGSDN